MLNLQLVYPWIWIQHCKRQIWFEKRHYWRQMSVYICHLSRFGQLVWFSVPRKAKKKIKNEKPPLRFWVFAKFFKTYKFAHCTSSRFKLLQSSKWQTTTALLGIAKHLKYIATNIEKDFFLKFCQRFPVLRKWNYFGF